MLSLKNVAVWGNHAVIKFIGNQTSFCQVVIFQKSSKIGILVFWYRKRGSFKENVPLPPPPPEKGKTREHRTFRNMKELN